MYSFPLACFLTLLCLACGLTGCASDNRQDNALQLSPSASIEEIESPRSSAGQSGMGSAEVSPEPGKVITLREALSLALVKNPELAGASWESRAAEARTLQAGVLPNPELGLTIEEFGGNRIRKNFDAAQTTIQLSQLVELGGKRAGRVRLARLEKTLADWDYEIKRLDVLTSVSKSFVEVLAAQELEALTSELVHIAEQVHNTVSERITAGKISPLEKMKSGISVSTAKIDLEKARSNLNSARYKLAATWGRSYPDFERAEGRLEEVKPIPTMEDLHNLISRNPDVARYVKELQQRSAALSIQRAKVIPDITVSGGLQYFSENDENAFAVGLTIPIPIFDRNRGGILEAGHHLAKAKEDYRAARVKTGSGLGEAFHSLSSAHSEVIRLRDEILPSAGQAFDSTKEGFREGKFDYIELLDAQRTFFSSRIRYVEALGAYHKAVVEIERLTGERLDAAVETHVQ